MVRKRGDKFLCFLFVFGFGPFVPGDGHNCRTVMLAKSAVDFSFPDGTSKRSLIYSVRLKEGCSVVS